MESGFQNENYFQGSKFFSSEAVFVWTGGSNY